MLSISFRRPLPIVRHSRQIPSQQEGLQINEEAEGPALEQTALNNVHKGGATEQEGSGRPSEVCPLEGVNGRILC